MNIIFFDDKEWANLRPLTLTKPLAELRMGILTFRERWEKLIEGNYSYLTKEYLSEKYPAQIESLNLFINPAYFPFLDLVQAIQNLKEGEVLMHQESLIAAKVSLEDFQNIGKIYSRNNYKGEILQINRLWDLFTYNHLAIKFDFEIITKGRKSLEISATNGILNPENVFLEEGAVVEFSVLNAKSGPIYIGKDAEIMEGSLVRGSLALCEGAKLNMGTKIYSGTTVGPHSKVGGEVNNSILMGYSNKGHEGFLGNSVLGEWCNLGADTNNSNLKNNYKSVRLYDYRQAGYRDTGLQFCGMVMGDHVRCAINTAFNTGTVVGVGASVCCIGMPPTFIPDFSWGNAGGFSAYRLEKLFETLASVYERRNLRFDDVEKRLLTAVFERTRGHRPY